jgi:hypothetical protein
MGAATQITCTQVPPFPHPSAYTNHTQTQTVAAQQDVGGLDVTVDALLAVQVRERARSLMQDVGDARLV